MAGRGKYTKWAKSDKITIGRVFAPEMNKDDFETLKDLVRTKTDVMIIFQYLTRFYKDPRSCWGVLEKALKEVGKLPIDNA